MLKKKKTTTLLVVALIAANLVATSATKSAWAMPNTNLAPLSAGEQRREFNRILEQEFSRARISREHIIRMQAIARCESRGHRHVQENGELMRNHTGAYVGLLQVAHDTHQEEIERLGLDVLGDVRAYVRFTLHLYRTDQRRGGDGFRPWPRCGAKTAP